MKMKLMPFLLMVFILAGRLSAQQNITIQLQFSFKGKPLVFRDSTYITPAGDTVSIDMCKLYLTNFKLLHNNMEVYKEKNSYHFIDAVKNKTSFILQDIHTQRFDEIEFSIGVDSLTNIAGIGTGDLDPVNAMYWAWNSGYINAKIEGVSNQCKTPQNRFEYHIGGYLAPFQSMQKVRLPLTLQDITAKDIKDKMVLVLNADLSKWFTDIHLDKEPSITTPSVKAVKMAKNYANMFSIIQ